MLTSIHIKNFRGFRDLKIEPFKRVNLIIGQNNTGKTGILEALALVLWEPNPGQCGILPTLFRSAGGEGNENFWKWLFYNKDLTKNVEIITSFDRDVLPPNRPPIARLGFAHEFGVILQANPKSPIELDTSTLKLAGNLGMISCYTTTGTGSINAGFKPAVFSTHPSDPVKNAIEYNRVILKRRKKQVEELLRRIEPRLQAVEALQVGKPSQGQTPLIYVDLGLSEMIPITQLGQGFNRLLDIYSEVLASDAKVLLIDEIENGLHHSVLPTIWKGLFLAAKEVGIQIFATTHSRECIEAADQVARESENYELALIRLDRVTEDIKSTVMDEKSLATARELKWEMR
jgi:AAA domain, putative AbiEii toxin, Type IV TA system/AAA domain